MLKDGIDMVLHHSHPRTFHLLSKLAKKYHVSLISLVSDNSLKDLCVRIRLETDSFKNKQIRIDIPNTLDDSSNNRKRIANCFSFWIPYCLEIADRLGNSFLLSLNASDWSHDHFLSMTSEDPENIIPDEYAMFESKEINNLREWTTFDQFYDKWRKRKNAIFWRGSTTGIPIDSIQSLTELKRIKVCLLYANKNGFDLRISNIVQNKIPKQLIRQWLIEKNIQGKRVTENRFRDFKYYPDISGNNEECGSWGAIKKYIRGNVIFRPNYKSHMFYDRLVQPWVHYIPVDSNFCDLSKQYDWAERHQHEVARIAWEGYCMADTYLRNLKDHFIDVALTKIKVIKSSI